MLLLYDGNFPNVVYSLRLDDSTRCWGSNVMFVLVKQRQLLLTGMPLLVVQIDYKRRMKSTIRF